MLESINSKAFKTFRIIGDSNKKFKTFFIKIKQKVIIAKAIFIFINLAIKVILKFY